MEAGDEAYHCHCLSSAVLIVIHCGHHFCVAVTETLDRSNRMEESILILAPRMKVSVYRSQEDMAEHSSSIME